MTRSLTGYQKRALETAVGLATEGLTYCTLGLAGETGGSSGAGQEGYAEPGTQPREEGVLRSEGYAVTESGVLIGTPGYMSPEHLLGENPAVSWDIWALAVVLYETLTGSLPFPLTESSNWRQLVLAGSYTPLGEHLTDPPASWQDFFARCLATKSTVGPLSAAEFFRQLEQALARVR